MEAVVGGDGSGRSPLAATVTAGSVTETLEPSSASYVSEPPRATDATGRAESAIAADTVLRRTFLLRRVRMGRRPSVPFSLDLAAPSVCKGHGREIRLGWRRAGLDALTACCHPKRGSGNAGPGAVILGL